MLVTLPCVMLLLDYWPLDRLRKTEPLPPPPAPAAAGKKSRGGKPTPQPQPIVQDRRKQIGMLILAKCRAARVVRDLQRDHLHRSAQGRRACFLGGHLHGPAHRERHCGLRAIHARDVLAGQSGRIYSHRLRYPVMWLVGSAAAMLLITLLVSFLALRGRRYPIVGWLWFLGTLVPVIGLVQVGDQAMADRYSYIPYIGLFVGLVWGAGTSFWLLTRWGARFWRAWPPQSWPLARC